MTTPLTNDTYIKLLYNIMFCCYAVGSAGECCHSLIKLFTCLFLWSEGCKYSLVMTLLLLSLGILASRTIINMQLNHVGVLWAKVSPYISCNIFTFLTLTAIFSLSTYHLHNIHKIRKPLRIISNNRKIFFSF
jgi:hypothetical protein